MGAVAMIAGLVVVTIALRDAEARHRALQREAARDDAIREALWRMDAVMTPRLAREAARPPSDYAAFRSSAQAVNRLLQDIPKGEVLLPSPLLADTPEWIDIHFEVRADGRVSSPQVPEGDWLDLAEGRYLKSGIEESRRDALDGLRKRLGSQAEVLEACAVAQVADLSEADGAPGPIEPQVMVQPGQLQVTPQALDRSERAQGDAAVRASKSRAMDDLATRVRAATDAQRESPPNAKGSANWVVARDQVGPLTPVWLEGGDAPQLACVRRVDGAEGTVIQGFVVDWSSVVPVLLAQASDLMSGASLVPTDPPAGSEAFSVTRMGSLPVELEPGTVHAEQRVARSKSQTGGAVLLAWGAGVGAIVIAALAAVAAIRFGDRQAKFASSVTHELRTPLTTFRLYSEMLRDGMVGDESRLRECHDTLVRESVRLGHLVENVLSLARLERGAGATPGPGGRATLDHDQLVRLLQAIATESAPGARVSIEVDAGVAGVRLEVDATTQILANLLDNAAKYGRSADGVADIVMSATAAAAATARAGPHVGAPGELTITVRDSGPGIPASKSAAIWRAFDRAGAEGGAQPGIGIGLALARALAERQGGSLVLAARESAQPAARGSGATFQLRLPG